MLLLNVLINFISKPKISKLAAYGKTAKFDSKIKFNGKKIKLFTVTVTFNLKLVRMFQ